MGHGIQFSVSPPGGDRLHHLTEEDVRVVLSRLPVEEWKRLRRVHFNDQSRGARTLGYVNRGRREIALCALPPRISLTRFLVKGQSPEQFGAKRGGKWSERAIRRFLLYDVFLHELGHLKIVDDKAKSVRRKFAREKYTQEFGMSWCKKLWSQPFHHPDAVHSPPSKEELADAGNRIADTLYLIERRPDDTELFQELGKLYLKQGELDEAKAVYEKSLELDPRDPWTHLFLGNWYNSQNDFASAIKPFSHAATLMPDCAVPFWCLAEAYEKQGRTELADAHYRRAVEVEPSNKLARTKLKAWRERLVKGN
ncbi:MAG: tetratricopeptide repeat protein [Pirellulaceae bacterium]